MRVKSGLARKDCHRGIEVQPGLASTHHQAGIPAGSVYSPGKSAESHRLLPEPPTRTGHQGKQSNGCSALASGVLDSLSSVAPVLPKNSELVDLRSEQAALRQQQ